MFKPIKITQRHRGINRKKINNKLSERSKLALYLSPINQKKLLDADLYYYWCPIERARIKQKDNLDALDIIAGLICEELSLQRKERQGILSLISPEGQLFLTQSTEWIKDYSNTPLPENEPDNLAYPWLSGPYNFLRSVSSIGGCERAYRIALLVNSQLIETDHIILGYMSEPRSVLSSGHPYALKQEYLSIDQWDFHTKFAGLLRPMLKKEAQTAEETLSETSEVIEAIFSDHNSHFTVARVMNDLNRMLKEGKEATQPKDSLQTIEIVIKRAFISADRFASTGAMTEAKDCLTYLIPSQSTLYEYVLQVWLESQNVSYEQYCQYHDRVYFFHHLPEENLPEEDQRLKSQLEQQIANLLDKQVSLWVAEQNREFILSSLKESLYSVDQ